jgi:hypothetical protein
MTEDRYEDWDAAYVLGALSPTERREYEDHLASCPRCTAAIAEFAVMPALLGKVSPDEAFAMLDESVAESSSPHAPEPASDLVPSLLDRIRRRQLRNRVLTIAISGLAAAAAVAAIFVLPVVTSPAATPTVSAQLQQTIASPLSASVTLTTEKWGTKLDMSCSYAASDEWGPEGGTPRYAMYVTDTSGTTTRVSSWTAEPGQTVTPSATIETPVSQIRSVDVRALPSGKVLLKKSILPAIS